MLWAHCKHLYHTKPDGSKFINRMASLLLMCAFLAFGSLTSLDVCAPLDACCFAILLVE